MQLFEYIDTLNKPYDIFYTNSVSSPLHWHYYSEILYIKTGSAAIICNGSKQILKQGDICYIYPLQLHEISMAYDESPEYAVIKFDLATLHIPQAYIERFYTCFVHRTSENDRCLIAECGDSKEIMKLFEHIVDEYTKKREFYSMQINADIYTLLIFLARKLNNINIRAGKHNERELSFYHILEYIDSHSGDKLEVSALADICGMSYSHFAKLFKENYGRTCKEYINHIRLTKAQELLFHTDYDLNYIAAETGFFDCSHFIKAYKKWRGITPKQERINSPYI